MDVFVRNVGCGLFSLALSALVVLAALVFIGIVVVGAIDALAHALGGY